MVKNGLGMLVGERSVSYVKSPPRDGRAWSDRPKIRKAHVYAEHSAMPKTYDAFVDQISKTWAHQPSWTKDHQKAIDPPDERDVHRRLRCLRVDNSRADTK